jgi:hypothetical protein
MRARFLQTPVFVLAMITAAVSRAEITIDGVLDEPEWQQAQVFDQFVSTEPLTGEPSPYHTEARHFTDEDGLYIGFTNYQPAEVKRIQRHFARDTFIRADRNIVNIDFDGNGLSGYDFTVGISNSMQDGIISNEKEYKPDWDGTWYSQTSQDADYWYSEIFIPWTVAPMTVALDGRKKMRFYFGRFIYDKSLRVAYPNAAMTRPTYLTDWQDVTVKQWNTSTLDWFPYISGVNDLQGDNDDLKAGLDVVWRPNSGTQFTGTLNPDFGQVESDDLVVNFSAFETFFSERRPFFTENQALFDSQVPGGDRLIHTRRIGAAPDVGDDFVTDILAGGKLSHYGQNLDYGVFTVAEDDEGNSKGRNYLTTRIQTRLDALVLGHSLTYADRPSLDRQAMVNSFDADWQGLGGARARGQLFISDIDQDANLANGDQDIDDTDNGGWTELSYAPDDINSVTAYILWYGEDFEMNDMGFLKRNDWFRTSIEYRRDTNLYAPESTLLNTYWRIKPHREANQDGDQLLAGVTAQYAWNFRSTEFITTDLNLETVHRRDDLITRGNGIARLKPQNNFYIGYASPRGDNFNYEVAYETGNRGTDKYSHEIEFKPVYYLTDTFNVSADLSYIWYDEWLLWDFRTEQLATYESTVVETSVNLDWYPDSKQEVRVKFQWVAVQSDAEQGYQLNSNGSLAESNIPVDDFSVSDTALQIRYRYRLAPLSDIYLVYTRGGFFSDDEDSQGLGDLWSNGWDDKTAEVILAKIRYRF